MPVTQHQNAKYFFTPASKNYRDNIGLVNFSKKTIMTEENTNQPAVEIKTGKKRGRPPGSKNKTTLEKERLAALPATTPVAPQTNTPDETEAVS